MAVHFRLSYDATKLMGSCAKPPTLSIPLAEQLRGFLFMTCFEESCTRAIQVNPQPVYFATARHIKDPEVVASARNESLPAKLADVVCL